MLLSGHADPGDLDTVPAERVARGGCECRGPPAGILLARPVLPLDDVVVSATDAHDLAVGRVAQQDLGRLGATVDPEEDPAHQRPL